MYRPRGAAPLAAALLCASALAAAGRPAAAAAPAPRPAPAAAAAAPAPAPTADEDPLPADDGGAPAAPSRGPLPMARWHTLETPHFHIHFYDDERALADHTAVIAERAYRLVTRYLNWR